MKRDIRHLLYVFFISLLMIGELGFSIFTARAAKNKHKESRQWTVPLFVAQLERFKSFIDCGEPVQLHYKIPDLQSGFSIGQLAIYSLAPCRVINKEGAPPSATPGFVLMHKSHPDAEAMRTKHRMLKQDNDFILLHIK